MVDHLLGEFPPPNLRAELRAIGKMSISLACLLARRLGREVTLTIPAVSRYGPVCL